MATTINKSAINQSFLDFYTKHKALIVFVKKYKDGVNAMSKMTNPVEIHANLVQMIELRAQIEKGIPGIVQALHQCISLLMPMAHKGQIRKRIDELTVCKAEYNNILKYISETMPLFKYMATYNHMMGSMEQQH